MTVEDDFTEEFGVKSADFMASLLIFPSSSFCQEVIFGFLGGSLFDDFLAGRV